MSKKTSIALFASLCGRCSFLYPAKGDRMISRHVAQAHELNLARGMFNGFWISALFWIALIIAVVAAA
jgi:hypothetical protein